MNKKIVSRRRNPDARVGFVNFPVDKYQNSCEGGVFVRLVVIDTEGDKEFMNRWVPCCGGHQSFHLDECFLGDDLLDRSYPYKDASEEMWEERQARLDMCQKRYFPRLDHEEERDYSSRHFLCVMTIGATGWSSSKWVCTFDDLTPEGTALVESLRKLYKGCEIRLLTFLDT